LRYKYKVEEEVLKLKDELDSMKLSHDELMGVNHNLIIVIEEYKQKLAVFKDITLIKDQDNRLNSIQHDS